MKGLLIKDLCLLNTQKRFFIIVIGMGILLTFAGQSSDFITGYLMMVFGIFAGSTISYDENNRGMGFLMTLPVNRKQYVRSKYLFMLLMILASMVISLVFGMVFGMASGMAETVSVVEMVGKSLLIASFMIIIDSIFLSLIIRFGAEKARTVIGILFGIFVLGLWGLGIIKDDQAFSVPFNVENLSDNMIVLVACAVSFVIMVVSYIFSVNAMQKKEF